MGFLLNILLYIYIVSVPNNKGWPGAHNYYARSSLIILECLKQRFPLEKHMKYTWQIQAQLLYRFTLEK